VDFNQILKTALPGDIPGAGRRRKGPAARGRAQAQSPAVVLFALALSALIVSHPTGAAGRDATEERSGTTWRRIAYYVPNRVVDFLDIWRFNAGVGLGLCINIRPTKGLQAGFGAYDSVRFGLRGRRRPFWHEWSLEGGFDGMYYELGQTERGFYEFGGTIHVLVVGLDAAFDIEEAIDFVYGVFLSDPEDDDFR